MFLREYRKDCSVATLGAIFSKWTGVSVGTLPRLLSHQQVTYKHVGIIAQFSSILSR
jgi:hypothetical protein